jgi:hypothetical protein
MSNWMSQKMIVLNHLRNERSLCAMDAIMLYRIHRLAGRIYDLKKMGHVIRADMETDPTGKRRFRYTLEE